MFQASTSPNEISTSRGLADGFRETDSGLGVLMKKDPEVTLCGTDKTDPGIKAQQNGKWHEEDKQEKAEICTALVLYNSKDKTEYTHIKRVLITAIYKDLPQFIPIHSKSEQ